MQTVERGKASEYERIRLSNSDIREQAERQHPKGIEGGEGEKMRGADAFDGCGLRTNRCLINTIEGI